MFHVMKKSLLLSVFTFSAAVSAAVAGETSSLWYAGNVMFPDSVPLPYTVAAKRDSSTLNMSYFNSPHFVVHAGGKASALKVSSYGFEDVEIAIPAPGSRMSGDTVYLAGTIPMRPKTEFLNEVVVVGKKVVVREEGLNYTVSNIQGSDLADAGTILDMMAWVPGTSLGPNDDIQVFGTNGTPLIYINDVKVTDKSKLTALSSNMVKKIEVIREPDARYPVGTSSVIRITTAVPLKDVLNANVIERATQSRRFRNYLSGNVFGTFGKFDILASLGWNNSDSRQSAVYTEDIYSKDGGLMRGISTDEKDYVHSRRWEWMAGVAYRPASADVIQIEYSGSSEKLRRDFVNARTTVTPDAAVSTDFDSRNDSRPDKHSLLGSYTHEFSKSTLKFLATYNRRVSDSHEKVYLMPENELDQINETRSTSEMWTVQGDYSWSFRDGDSQSAGLYGGKSTNTSFSDYSFTGQQNVKSSVEWGEAFVSSKWDISGYGLTVGLRARYEHQESNSVIDGRNTDYDNSYLNVVPNISLYHRFSKKLALNLNYRYTYSLPTFSELSPAITLDDLIYYRTGNPDLKIPRRHYLALVFNLPSVMLAAEYFGYKNRIVEVTTPVADTEYFLTRPENMSGNYTLGLQASYSKNFTNRLRLYASLNLKHSHSEYIHVDELVKRDKLSAMAYLNVSYNILPNLSVFGTTWYSSPQLYQNINVGYSCNLSFGGNISLLKSGLSLRLAVNDILARSVTPWWTSYSPNLYSTRRNYYDTRNVSLTVTYRFSLAKKKYSELDNADDYDRM